MQTLEIPVECLRWTHCSVNRSMVLGHGGEKHELHPSDPLDGHGHVLA